MFTLDIELRILIPLFCAVLPCIARAEQHPSHYIFRKDIKGRHIEVTLTLKPFDPNHHHLEKQNGIAYIDGTVPVGTDNSFSAFTEFSEFDVRWDGRSVKIPKSCYADLFNASLVPKKNAAFDTQGSVWVSVSDDGDAVLIEFEGSEAGGAYKVWLIIQRDGKCQRFVENTTP